MIKRVSYLESNSTNPYHNLALEEYLFFNCAEDECIFYLWQNSNTVVIGKNQNAWKECNISLLENENGKLARRLSGGGAVYHDDGNLNFTFVTRKENYSVDKQLKVIINAIAKYGIEAEKSGRNDILVDGKKISGNAFYERNGKCYHHGTIMMDVDVTKLSKFLTVSKEKLSFKGIDSVKSRVANLKDFNGSVELDTLKRYLRESFEEVYECKSDNYIVENSDEIDVLERKYKSWKWILGNKIDFQYEISNAFPWGSITLQFKVNKGYIEDIEVFSDSMNPEIRDSISSRLIGAKYDRKEIAHKLVEDELFDSNNIYDINSVEMIQNIKEWIESVEL